MRYDFNMVEARRNRLIFAFLVSLVVVSSAVLLTWREEVGLLFNNEGFRPSLAQVSTFLGLFVVLCLAMWGVACTLEWVKRDYEAHLALLKQDGSPPVLGEPDSDPYAATVAAYNARGFVFHSKLDDVEDAAEVWSSSAVIQDQNDMHRRAGVIIYPDGTATQFSVAVLYGADVWQLGNETRVRRNQLGRPVSVQTAIDRPLVRELIQSNDYVLGVGLASSIATRREERNERLAHARAFNIGYAVLRLGLKSADRVYSVSLGYSTRPPVLPDLEPRQRAVVIVGVNASRDVVVEDVVSAAARLIALEGVNLGHYSRAGENIVRFPTLGQATDYLRVEDVPQLTEVAGKWVLPALHDETDGSRRARGASGMTKGVKLR